MFYRKEAIEAKKNRLSGKVILTQPPSLYLISIITFIIVLLVSIFLAKYNYSRKETVKGYLLPKMGVVKVYSGRKGVLEELFVNEGNHILAGNPIAKIRNSQSMVSGMELSTALSKEIKSQIKAMSHELETNEIVFFKDKQRIDRQLIQLEKSLLSIKNTRSTSQQRLALKDQKLKNNQKLHQKGFLSSTLFSSIQEEYLIALEAVDKLEQDISSISLEISTLKSDKIALPDLNTLKQVAIQRQISKLKEQLIELDNQYEFVKNAPESGVVTAIQPTVGTQIDTDTPILSIIPDNSPLEIELLLPTRSAGFVQLGDLVKIRFHAFPYQKFGLAHGKVINIDQALILPTDTILPIKIEEAIYRVRVSLNKQEISAYGKSFPLKVGMLADANIILEKRTLLEWLLDPIYAIRGKIG